MATTAGALSKVLVGPDSASLLSAVATGGSAPYTYQWYRSTVGSGFTPDGTNIISGATALSLSDSGLANQTNYWYKVIAIDSGAVASTSSALAITTMAAASPSISQFALSPALGELDLAYNYNSISVMLDSSQVGAAISGQAVKIVNSAGGVPKVVVCSANTDEVFGFLNFNFKKTVFFAGDYAEISQKGNVIHLFATTAIPRGSQVTLDVTTIGGVGVLVGSSGADVCGFALDQGAIGGLIRVEVNVPSFLKA